MTADHQGADPLAAGLAKPLAGLPIGDLLRLLLALGGGPRLDAGVGRAYLALSAVATCAAETGQPPSPDDYQQWRASQDRPDEWPSVDFITRTFRQRWSPVIAALGLPLPATHRVRRASPHKGPYTANELADGLRAYIATLPDGAPVRQDAYFRWARRRLTQPDAPDRLGLHPQPFIREFGSWMQAIAAARRDRTS